MTKITIAIVTQAVIIYYAKMYYMQYNISISLGTLSPVGVGVKVPAGSLLNCQAT
jgi:hypothetical protein